MLKKPVLLLILFLSLLLAYGIYTITSAQGLIKESFEKLNSLNTLYYTGSFSILINGKRHNYTYDYNSQVKIPDEGLVSIKSSINNTLLNYQLYLDKNNQIYIKNSPNQSWQKLKDYQKGYYLNPYTPLKMKGILDSLNNFSSFPMVKGETRINNKTVKIISVNLDSTKLTNFFRSLYKNRAKESKVFNDFMEKLDPTGQYLLYIDPKTKYLHRLEITINTSSNGKKYTYRTTYSFYKFNSSVKMPRLGG